MTTISTLQATSALSVLTRASTASGSPSSAAGSAATANQLQVSTTSGATSAAGHAALIASLKNQDSQSSDSSDIQSVAKVETVGYANALSRQNAAMTSAQVSDAFYSGKGINAGAQMMQISDMVTQLSNDAKGFANSEDAQTSEQYQKMSDDVQTAFANHTLVIQTATDVPGLVRGSVEQYIGSDDSTDTSKSTGGFLENMDTLGTLVNNAKGNANTWGFGGVVFFLSWPQQ